jgi:hypothetical protein
VLEIYSCKFLQILPVLPDSRRARRGRFFHLWKIMGATFGGKFFHKWKKMGAALFGKIWKKWKFMGAGFHPETFSNFVSFGKNPNLLVFLTF